VRTKDGDLFSLAIIIFQKRFFNLHLNKEDSSEINHEANIEEHAISNEA